ncbi:MAG: aromatic amino acid transport family protein [archaeon]
MKKVVMFEAIATLMAFIIGAGILGLPYVIAKSGFLIGMIEIIILGAILLITNLMMGEVMLRTNGDHQLPGYAKKYLGKFGKIIMLIAIIFGLYGPLLAYMIGTGEALHAIFPVVTPFVFSIIIFVILSAMIYLGLKAIEESEFGMMFVLIAIILAICIIAIFSGNFNTAYLQDFNMLKFALPYGVVMFALMGTPALPEVREELKNNRGLLKKVIIWGSALPIILYIIFTLAVIGVTGASTTEIATLGLGAIIGPKMVLLGNLLAIFAMTTSFMAVGLALKEVYKFDLKMSKNLAWFLTIIIPLVLFLVGARNFIKTLGYAGAVAGGLMSILVVFMFWQAKKYGERKPEYQLKKNCWISILIIIVFILGIAYQFWF